MLNDSVNKHDNKTTAYIDLYTQYVRRFSL